MTMGVEWGLEAQINLLHKFLRSAGFCLAVVQAGVISGQKDSL